MFHYDADDKEMMKEKTKDLFIYNCNFCDNEEALWKHMENDTS